MPLKSDMGFRKKSVPASSAFVKGSRDFIFEYQLWRIHCTLLLASDGKEYVVRQEYTKIWNTAVMKSGGKWSIQDYERDAVFKGESGKWTWRVRGYGEWVRDDGAIALLSPGNNGIVFELPQLRKYKAELKMIEDRKARAAVPEF